MKEAVNGLGEVHLQNLWYERFTGGRVVESDAGLSVRIISPGRWNRGPGPDFINSRFIIDGKEMTGDVEVHKAPDEWYQHRHHTDPAYDNVRLHFSLFPANHERIRNSTGRLVPQIFLETICSPDMLKIIADYRCGESCFSPYWGNPECRCGFRKADPSRIESYFLQKGDERITAKKERLGGRIREAGYEQVVYEGLLESSGYTVNKHQFLALAALLPLKPVREILQWTDPGERRFTAEALLLGTARLLPDQSGAGELDLDGSIHARELQSRWRKLRIAASYSMLEPGFIIHGGQRPSASPARSLAAVAAFIAEHFDRNLFELFYRVFNETENDVPTSADRIKQILNCSPPGFWSNRAVFNGSNERGWAAFGSDKANRFAGNILIPIFLHHCERRRDRRTEKMLLQSAHSLPAAHNRYTKFIFSQLPENISKRIKLTFAMEQGIIAHYAQNCSSNTACLDCPLKNIL